MKPSVSVVIPVFNTAAYLPALFAALKAQTLDALEFVFVDDGSSDASPVLLDAFAIEDARARVIHVANGGVSRARNTAIAAAQGDYIAFCDSDDLPQPDHYASLLTIMQSHPGVQLGLVNGWQFQSTPGDLDLTLFTPDAPQGVMSAVALLEDRVAAGNPVWNVYLSMIDRAWLAARPLAFREGMVHEDILWYVELMLADPQACYQDIRSYYYRRHDQSISKKLDPTHRLHRMASYARLLHALFDLYPAANDPRRYRIVRDVAQGVFQEARWLCAELPGPTRRSAYALLRANGVLGLLWRHAADLKTRRQIAKLWLTGLFA